MTQQADKTYYPCCGAWEGDVVPYSFGEWLAFNGVLANYIGPTHEETLRVDIHRFYTYLLQGTFSKYYYEYFRDHVNRIFFNLREEFDFLPANPHLGFLTFKEWTQRTIVWYKEYGYPNLTAHELHLKLVDEYIKGPLSLSPEDLESFREHRGMRVKGISHELVSEPWTRFGLCAQSH
ncbi:hypothetical protein BGZ57DRAFT_923247 [Hyaloscypha finlandica]|nr:hypothetical protein BGZ57DRAFT_923247 [Hyaloscypha finlandica]